MENEFVCLSNSFAESELKLKFTDWSVSSQFSNGSGWKVSRYPEYAERAHEVLSREGARQVSVLGFCPGRPPPGSAPMLTGAPNKVRGRSA